MLRPLTSGNDRTLLTSNLCVAWWALSKAVGRHVTLSRVPYRRHMAAAARVGGRP
ncbi:hypothetical protein [[Actinomadura] parvosata]|uniref:hypothetical protein n=1 Tax=[Actinomadura] parvosata TaxID=1955412 RepID=UPI0012BCB01B|nr:hypothetical protein [Nonomuraea sp. ATCC 55076]